VVVLLEVSTVNSLRMSDLKSKEGSSLVGNVRSDLGSSTSSDCASGYVLVNGVCKACSSQSCTSCFASSQCVAGICCNGCINSKDFVNNYGECVPKNCPNCI